MGFRRQLNYAPFLSLAVVTMLLCPPVAAQQGEMTPTLWDYGDVPLGEVRSTSFEIVSMGGTQLAITSIRLDADLTGAFSITSVSPPVPPFLTPGEQIEVFVEFAPLTPGEHTAWLSILSDNEGGDIRTSLVGHGIPEPATMTMLALGGLAMLKRRRRSCRRSGAEPKG
jgi:hypothetical protein